MLLEALHQISVPLQKKTTAYSRDYTEKALDYTQAVEAHQDATNAYIRLVAIYERLLLKCWHHLHMPDS